MPHFFAKSLDFLSNLRKAKGIKSGESFDFLFEVRSLRDDSYLILAQNKSDSRQKIMLSRQKKGDKFLVKFNKHFKVNSRQAIKTALKDYANLTNAEIISHNLNESRRESKSQYLLDSREILEILANDSNKNSRFLDSPKMLEIGFGSGRHILNLARNNPHCTIIGLEIYRPAILQVLRQIELLGLSNLFIANIDARALFELIHSESLNAIFLHFPVPWEQNPQRRVFSEFFLTNALRALDSQNGRFELVTDSKEYFSFAKKIAKNYRTKTTLNPQNSVISKYEARWIALCKTIYKLEIFPQKREAFALLERFKLKSPKKMLQSAKTPQSTNLAQKSANLKPNIAKIHALGHKKIRQKEYFLQIKDKYAFDENEMDCVIYVVFGAYYAPSSAYIIIRQDSCEILGDIIPTNANVSALNEILENVK